MKRKPTEAQRKAAAEKRKRMRELAKKIGAMSAEERQAMADRMGLPHTIEGHKLSVFNTCLLYAQGVQPTVVGGYRQWRKAGRTVRKGQHGACIWCPAVRKRGDEAPGDDEVRFVFGTVFDISQTEPLESEAPA